MCKLLLSHRNNSYAKAHQYYIIIMLSFMFRAFYQSVYLSSAGTQVKTAI